MPINTTAAKLLPASAGFGRSAIGGVKAQVDQASVFSDLNSLNTIRKLGLNDETAALKKAAKEFEAFFMNMMLKSMRQASEVIGADSMLSSQQEKMFTGMMDEQLSVDLSQKGLLGIADLMMEQLQRDKNGDSTALTQISMPTSSTSSAVNATVIAAQINEVAPPLEQKVKTKTVTEPELLRQFAQATVITPAEPASRQAIVTQEAPQKKALFERVSDFVSTLAPFAKSAAEKLGLDPKILLAQAALETGWGKYVMHDEKGKPGFNLFGIKAGPGWDGKRIEIDTLEVEQQQVKKVNAAFRQYDNLAESFDDYVSFISDNPRYQNALNATSKPESYVVELQKSGYATDPDYARKILSVFKQEALQNITPDNIYSEGLGPR